MTDDLMEEDLYGLLGVEQGASLKEIQKAWRKKALTCHPDKYPDDESKAAMFIKLSKVLDILSDPIQRSEYDNRHKARALRLEKKRKMDANTRKLRDDLEARERTFKRARKEEDDDKIALQNEIERLREDGLRKLREIEQRRQQRLAEAQRLAKKRAEDATLKIKWPSTEKHDEASLRKAFSPCGKISHLLIGKKGKSALLVFDSPHDAVACHRTMNNHPLYKFQLAWASGNAPVLGPKAEAEAQSFLNPPHAQPSLLATSKPHEELLKAHQSFEEMILSQMRGAANSSQ